MEGKGDDDDAYMRHPTCVRPITQTQGVGAGMTWGGDSERGSFPLQSGPVMTHD